VSIPVTGDAIVEDNQQLKLKLSGPVGASIQFGTGGGSILNDDTV
jgi:hypothetical protein